MENNNTLISVIVPVFNVETTLERCITSILEQTYKNLDIILVNDGSTDLSPEICQKIIKEEDRIRYISKENGGLSSARNTGIEYAQGEYLCFVDSDDWIAPDYIRILFDMICSYDVDIAACRYYEIAEFRMITESVESQIDIMNPLDFLKLYLTDHGISVFAWNKLYKKSLFKSIRYPETKLYEDIVPMFLLTEQASKIAVTSKKLYYYWNNPNSISRSAFNENDEDYIEQWEIIQERCDSEYPGLKKIIKHRLIFSHFRLLNKIAVTQKKDLRQFARRHIRYLRNHGFCMIADPYLRILTKVQIILMICNYKLYKILYTNLKKQK